MVKKLLRVIALFVAGSAPGLVLGIYVAGRISDFQMAAGMRAQESLLDSFARVQFDHADRGGAREALLYAIQTHQEMRAKQLRYTEFRKWSLGWCYARLSVLEESAGNVTIAKDYMERAKRELNPRGANEAFIRQTIQRPASDRGLD